MPCTRRLTILAATLLLAACGGTEDAGTSDARPRTATAGPRVPAAPTADDQLPSAIVGQAGPLMGIALRYVPGDSASTGYLAVPEGAGPFPALVIVHEWNGLVDRVRQVADNFAAEGYVTLAVDLYDGRTGANAEENMALVREVQGNQEKMLANMNAAVAYLKGRPDVTGRVGSMGWCFGGGVALSFGLDGDNHDATAIFYG
ncbi:MAG TPA: dienelactone hydrolase family protein, partial [Longimicrobiales bacterium]|nr:dienelactone hydrolase family protein [Longimicrobiales bacterium]